jgi:hypothetical protein
MNFLTHNQDQHQTNIQKHHPRSKPTETSSHHRSTHHQSINSSSIKKINHHPNQINQNQSINKSIIQINPQNHQTASIKAKSQLDKNKPKMETSDLNLRQFHSTIQNDTITQTPQSAITQ